VSWYDKTNYDPIPLGTGQSKDYKNTTTIIRIPKDESARVIDGLLFHVLYNVFSRISGEEGGPTAAQTTISMTSFAGGQLPGVTPILAVPAGWAMYASGLNPPNWDTGNPILSRDAEILRGWEGAKGMLSWTGKEMGLANFLKYNPDANTTMESVLYSTPGINRLIKTTDQGYRERQENQIRELERIRKVAKHHLSDDVQRAAREYNTLLMKPRETLTDPQLERRNALGQWYNAEVSPAMEEMVDALNRGDTKEVEQVAGQVMAP
jgi:hypothetical protein